MEAYKCLTSNDHYVTNVIILSAGIGVMTAVWTSIVGWVLKHINLEFKYRVIEDPDDYDFDAKDLEGSVLDFIGPSRTLVDFGLTDQEVEKYKNINDENDDNDENDGNGETINWYQWVNDFYKMDADLDAYARYHIYNKYMSTPNEKLVNILPPMNMKQYTNVIDALVSYLRYSSFHR
jgi:hypothetical protein